MKELSDISWNVTEPEYREDPALSYSTLARYEREGKFSSLPTLFEKQTTSSLTFGSMVDVLITGSEEEFANQFVVIDDPNISDTLKDITYALVERYPETTTSFDSIPDEVLAEVGKAHDYYSSDKYASYRVRLIRENCKTYYSLLKLSRNKTIVSPKDVEDARKCVEALRSSKYTKFLFEENNPFDPRFKRYYQLKFKCTDENTGVEYRSMSDLLIVDYERKIIYPYDLKTSSHDEWEFPKSFTKYMYHNQARLYWRNIRQNLDKDDFFKDFLLDDYRFIVVNRKNRKPLVWRFRSTKTYGDLKIQTQTGYTYVWRDPYKIGEELRYYLNNTCELPIGITEDNDIVEYLITN